MHFLLLTAHLEHAPARPLAHTYAQTKRRQTWQVLVFAIDQVAPETGHKYTTPVRFPEELDLRRVAGVSVVEGGAATAAYCLRAIVVHRGHDETYRHYVAAVRHGPHGPWFLADDATIRRCARACMQRG